MPSSKDKESLLETSYSLLEEVKNPSNKDAWAKFVSIYDQYIYNILRKIGLNQSDAEELCQDVIVKLWKKLPELAYKKERGKFRSWLNTVIRNSANDFYRKKNQSNNTMPLDEANEDVAQIVQISNSDLDSIITEEWNHHLSNIAWNEIKDKFKESTREVFNLYIEGKSKTEIAKACGLKEESVRKYILRIRNSLKEIIDSIDKNLL